LWLVVGLVVDLTRWVVGRKPFMALRMLAFGWVYMAVGMRCLVTVGWQWLRAGFGRNRERMREGSYRLQEWWAAALFGAVKRIFRLEVSVEGLDRVRPGPVIVMMRHASIVDTLLPNVFVTRQAGIRLRYVLKRELLADPNLDIAGNRLINHFVDRDGDSGREVAAVLALASGMTEGEGVLIYPEGTRFTESRRRRIIAATPSRRSGRPPGHGSRRRHRRPHRAGAPGDDPRRLVGANRRLAGAAQVRTVLGGNDSGRPAWPARVALRSLGRGGRLA
jgi:1-acyl-sn-glycerol-3-phosphate acyltransferase